MRQPGTRLLSSQLTFFYKFIFTSFWLVLFVATTILMFISSNPEIKELMHRSEFPVILIVVVVITALLLWCYVPIKKVELLEDRIRVTNFSDTAEIPLEHIESVSASRLMNPELIIIRLRSPSIFGSTIRFIGEYRPFGGWNRPPAARKLDRCLEKLGR